MENRLNEEGFIMQYLISGLREEPFIDHTADENQLRYEKYLRSILTRPQTKEPQDRVKLNETEAWVFRGDITITMETGL